jgi:hypothetical protein
MKYFVVRVIPKPGLPLANKDNYELMLTKAHRSKDHEVNLTIVQVQRSSVDEKENKSDDSEDSELKTKKKKKVCCSQ